MSLVLEISPELEAELEASAAQNGQSVEEFVLEAVRLKSKRMASPAPGSFCELLGVLKGKIPSVDEFLAEKHADIEREEANSARF